jgi:hypothetical protein
VVNPLDPDASDVEHRPARETGNVNGRQMPKTIAHQLGGQTAVILLQKVLPEVKFVVPGYVTRERTRMMPITVRLAR